MRFDADGGGTIDDPGCGLDLDDGAHDHNLDFNDEHFHYEHDYHHNLHHDHDYHHPAIDDYRAADNHHPSHHHNHSATTDNDPASRHDDHTSAPTGVPST